MGSAERLSAEPHVSAEPFMGSVGPPAWWAEPSAEPPAWSRLLRCSPVGCPGMIHPCPKRGPSGVPADVPATSKDDRPRLDRGAQGRPGICQGRRTTPKCPPQDLLRLPRVSKGLPRPPNNFQRLQKLCKGVQGLPPWLSLPHWTITARPAGRRNRRCRAMSTRQCDPATRRDKSLKGR